MAELNCCRTSIACYFVLKVQITACTYISIRTFISWLCNMLNLVLRIFCQLSTPYKRWCLTVISTTAGSMDRDDLNPRFCSPNCNKIFWKSRFQPSTCTHVIHRSTHNHSWFKMTYFFDNGCHYIRLPICTCHAHKNMNNTAQNEWGQWKFISVLTPIHYSTTHKNQTKMCWISKFSRNSVLTNCLVSQDPATKLDIYQNFDDSMITHTQNESTAPHQWWPAVYDCRVL